MKKVYLVDDDRDLVESTTMILESAGYQVKSQLDDKNLEENVRSYNPDLVILDVMFPDDEGAGFKMARALRHHDGLKEKPILMLSGVNKEGSFAGKFSNKDIDDIYLPITEFVEKPINPKKLIEKIEKLIA